MTASFESRRTYFAAALLLLSALPSAQAYCYIDDFQRERCTMSTGTRVIIGIIIAVVFGLIAFSMMWMRRRRVQRQNLTYVTQPAAPTAPPAYPPQGAVFNDGGAYMASGNGYYPGYGSPYPAPAYPPPAHDGWNPQAGFAPAYQPPKYSPPEGTPPSQAKEAV